MASKTAEYDENLLASAPAATKAQLQGGYTTDLLAEKATPPSSQRGHGRDVEPGRSSNGSSKPSKPTPPEAPLTPAKLPFYRTKKGIVILAVVAAVVIIAAAVGGGVGGSRKKSNNTSAQPAGSAPAPSTSSNSGPPVTTQDGAPGSSSSNPFATIPTSFLNPTPSPSAPGQGGAPVPTQAPTAPGTDQSTGQNNQIGGAVVGVDETGPGR